MYQELVVNSELEGKIFILELNESHVSTLM